MDTIIMEKESTAAVIMNETTIENACTSYGEDVLHNSSVCSVGPLRSYTNVDAPICAPFKDPNSTQFTTISMGGRVGMNSVHDSALVSESGLVPFETPATNQHEMTFLTTDSVLNAPNLESSTSDISLALASSKQLGEATALAENGRVQGLCRICANNAFKLIPLFHGDNQSLGLLEKINRCLPVKVSETKIHCIFLVLKGACVSGSISIDKVFQVSVNDHFPHEICDDCVSKLQICDDFISTSIAGNNKLMALCVNWVSFALHIFSKLFINEFLLISPKSYLLSILRQNLRF